jgi:hypothetical protein
MQARLKLVRFPATFFAIVFALAPALSFSRSRTRASSSVRESNAGEGALVQQ